MKEWIPAPDCLDSEQRARLWEFRLHTENQLYTRMSVFLTFETILIAVVGTLYTSNALPMTLLIILIVLGMLITLIWLYAQHNIRQVFSIMDRRTFDNLPEHRETLKRVYDARKWVSRLGIRAPVLLLLTYLVPVLILAIWISLLFYLQHWLL